MSEPRWSKPEVWVMRGSGKYTEGHRCLRQLILQEEWTLVAVDLAEFYQLLPQLLPWTTHPEIFSEVTPGPIGHREVVHVRQNFFYLPPWSIIM